MLTIKRVAVPAGLVTCSGFPTEEATAFDSAFRMSELSRELPGTAAVAQRTWSSLALGKANQLGIVAACVAGGACPGSNVPSISVLMELHAMAPFSKQQLSAVIQ
jgi:hypothetical protein